MWTKQRLTFPRLAALAGLLLLVAACLAHLSAWGDDRGHGRLGGRDGLGTAVWVDDLRTCPMTGDSTARAQTSFAS